MITYDPIVYFVEPTEETDAYTNLSKTGTRGLELVFQYKKKWGGIDANGSYYYSNDGKDVTDFKVPGKENIHLGLANYKGNLSMHVLFTPYLQLGSNITWLSQRNGVDRVTIDDLQPVYKKYPSFLLLNAHLEYRFKNIRGLSTRIGIKNLLNEKELFIQPYASNHAPLPGMQRELVFKLTYQNF